MREKLLPGTCAMSGQQFKLIFKFFSSYKFFILFLLYFMFSGSQLFVAAVATDPPQPHPVTVDHETNSGSRRHFRARDPQRHLYDETDPRNFSPEFRRHFSHQDVSNPGQPTSFEGQDGSDFETLYSTEEAIHDEEPIAPYSKTKDSYDSEPHLYAKPNLEAPFRTAASSQEQTTADLVAPPTAKPVLKFIPYAQEDGSPYLSRANPAGRKFLSLINAKENGADSVADKPKLQQGAIEEPNEAAGILQPKTLEEEDSGSSQTPTSVPSPAECTEEGCDLSGQDFPRSPESGHRKGPGLLIISSNVGGETRAQAYAARNSFAPPDPAFQPKSENVSPGKPDPTSLTQDSVSLTSGLETVNSVPSGVNNFEQRKLPYYRSMASERRRGPYRPRPYFTHYENNPYVPPAGAPAKLKPTDVAYMAPLMNPYTALEFPPDLPNNSSKAPAQSGWQQFNHGGNAYNPVAGALRNGYYGGASRDRFQQSYATVPPGKASTYGANFIRTVPPYSYEQPGPPGYSPYLPDYHGSGSHYAPPQYQVYHPAYEQYQPYHPRMPPPYGREYPGYPHPATREYYRPEATTTLPPTFTRPYLETTRAHSPVTEELTTKWSAPPFTEKVELETEGTTEKQETETYGTLRPTGTHREETAATTRSTTAYSKIGIEGGLPVTPPEESTFITGAPGGPERTAPGSTAASRTPVPLTLASSVPTKGIPSTSTAALPSRPSTLSTVPQTAFTTLPTRKTTFPEGTEQPYKEKTQTVGEQATKITVFTKRPKPGTTRGHTLISFYPKTTTAPLIELIETTSRGTTTSGEETAKTNRAVSEGTTSGILLTPEQFTTPEELGPIPTEAEGLTTSPLETIQSGKTRPGILQTITVLPLGLPQPTTLGTVPTEFVSTSRAPPPSTSSSRQPEEVPEEYTTIPIEVLPSKKPSEIPQSRKPSEFLPTRRPSEVLPETKPSTVGPELLVTTSQVPVATQSPAPRLPVPGIPARPLQPEEGQPAPEAPKIEPVSMPPAPEVPTNPAPEKLVSEQPTPEKLVPRKPGPERPVPEQPRPEGRVPGQIGLEGRVPGQPGPEGGAPEQPGHEERVPGQPGPEGRVPGQLGPEGRVPGQPRPEERVPGQPGPEGGVPEQPGPEELAPGPPTPTEQVPEQPAPGELLPEQPSTKRPLPERPSAERPTPGQPPVTAMVPNRIRGKPKIICVEDGIQFEITTLFPFTGQIFAHDRKRVPECFFTFSEERDVKAVLPYEECGVKNAGQQPVEKQYHMQVIVVFEQKDGTSSLQSFIAQCEQQKIHYQKNTIPRRIEEALEELEQKAPIPECTMRVLMENDHGHHGHGNSDNEGTEVDTVDLGQPMRIEWRLVPESDAYGFHIRNCTVKDRISGEEYLVIDTRGCSTDINIFGHPHYDTYHDVATVHWHAFKVPDDSQLNIRCSFEVCSDIEDSKSGISSCASIPSPPYCPDVITSPTNSILSDLNKNSVRKRSTSVGESGGLHQHVHADICFGDHDDAYCNSAAFLTNRNKHLNSVAGNIYSCENNLNKYSTLYYRAQQIRT